jgi:hypothetical protein
VRREESRKRSRRCEQQRNDDAEERRADEREDDLRRCQSSTAGKEPDRDGAERTCPAVIRKDAGGDADKLCGVPRYVAQRQINAVLQRKLRAVRHILVRLQGAQESHHIRLAGPSSNCPSCASSRQRR